MFATRRWRTMCAFLAVIVGLGARMDARAGDPFFGMRKLHGNFLEPAVAVGVNRIIVAGNLRVACYDRQGNEVWRASLANDDDGGFSSNHFWTRDGQWMPVGTSITDVRCLYDQHSQRFIVTMEDQDTPALYMAISKGYDAQVRPNDPVSWDDLGWDKFYIDTCLSPPPCQASPFHWTGLAATPDLIFLTSVATTLQIDGQPAGHSLFTFRKPPLGAPLNYYDDPNNYAELQIPTGYILNDAFAQCNRLHFPAYSLDTGPNQPLYLLQVWKLADPSDSNNGKLKLHAVQNPLSANPTRSEHMLTVERIYTNPDYFGIRCPAMPDAQQVGPDSFGAQNVLLRSGKLYFSHSTVENNDSYTRRNVGRWYELDLHGWPGSGQPPTVVQLGRVDAGRVFVDDNPANDRPVHVTYPLVAPLANGNIVLAFARFSERSYVDACWTAHRTTDGVGVMGAPVSVMFASSAGFSDPFDFGEYLGLAIDPTQPYKVWSCSEVGRCTTETPCSPCGQSPLAHGIGIYQEWFHTVIGSYTTSTAPIDILRIRRFAGGGPDALTVKVMPADIDAQIDASISSATPEASRRFGRGTTITLLAPPLDPDWEFKYWRLDGEIVTPSPTGWTPRLLTVSLIGEHVVEPAYSTP